MQAFGLFSAALKVAGSKRSSTRTRLSPDVYTATTPPSDATTNESPRVTVRDLKLTFDMPAPLVHTGSRTRACPDAAAPSKRGRFNGLSTMGIEMGECDSQRSPAPLPSGAPSGRTRHLQPERAYCQARFAPAGLCHNAGMTWPALPLDQWRDTRDTLQMWMQISGKVCLALTPRVNHFWNIAFHPTPRGLTTPLLWQNGRTFTILFDLTAHAVVIETSEG